MKNYDNQYATVEYDAKDDVLILSYHSPPPADEFMKINQHLLSRFQSLSTNKFYVDSRKMGTITPENKQYIMEVLLPEMISHLKGQTLYHVQILSDEIFTKASADNIRKESKKKMPDSVKMAAFTLPATGMKWLLSQA